MFADLIAGGWRPPISNVSVTGTGAQSYTLGLTADVYSVHGVYYVNGTSYAPLKRLNEGDRAAMMSPGGSRRAGYYSLAVDMTTGPAIELFPPPSGGTYRVEYIPDFPGFANDAASWRGPARSDELISLDAARQGVLKEGRKDDAQTLDNEYLMGLMRVVEHAGRFDMRNPAMIREERGMGSLDLSDYDAAGPGSY